MGKTAKLLEYQAYIKNELDACVKFWLDNGMDTVNGGIYTCLDREGKIFSTDKSVWMQGRCAWLFAHLCNVYGVRKEWLDASKSCIDFMEKHCINNSAGGRMYFTVTADGKPLRQRRYCFSEAFYIIANAEYSAASGDKTAMERAKKYYELVYNLNNGIITDPVKLGAKTISATRTGKSLADPMIFLNTTAIMRKFDQGNKDLYDKRSTQCVDQILNYHFKPELKCTLESVGLKGEFADEYTAGRVVNPGHDMECSWFLIEEANLRGNKDVHAKAIEMFDYAFKGGWDEQYGGMLYFVDCLGKPPESYEHDMKLWWPHNETLIASLMIYRDTGDESYLEKFDRTLSYCKEHFSDPLYGEWYGYLRRDGKPTEPPCKGSTFKGPFHLPRMLVILDGIIKEILSK